MSGDERNMWLARQLEMTNVLIAQMKKIPQITNICTVKLANSTSPFEFRQVKFPQKTCLENDKNVFLSKRS